MSKLLLKLRNRKGFTLIELIVVIAILGILAAILIPQFSGFQDKAKTTQALVDAKNWATAADAYLFEHPAADVAALNAAEATITSVAGTTGDPTVTAIFSGHAAFTYTVQPGGSGKFYAAVRDNTGAYKTGFGATAAAAIAMAG